LALKNPQFAPRCTAALAAALFLAACSDSPSEPIDSGTGAGPQRVSVEFNYPSAVFAVGDTAFINAVVLNDGAFSLLRGSWQVRDTSVVRITQLPNTNTIHVAALREGEATLTFSVAGRVDSLLVRVSYPFPSYDRTRPIETHGVDIRDDGLFLTVGASWWKPGDIVGESVRRSLDRSAGWPRATGMIHHYERSAYGYARTTDGGSPIGWMYWPHLGFATEIRGTGEGYSAVLHVDRTVTYYSGADFGQSALGRPMVRAVGSVNHLFPVGVHGRATAAHRDHGAVGYVFTSDTLVTRAFRHDWYLARDVHPGAAHSSRIVGMTEQGVAFGSISPNASAEQAALWATDGTLTVLPGLGGSRSGILGVNAAGTIFLGYSTRADGVRSPTIWVNREPVDVGRLAGAPLRGDRFEEAVAMNASGQIIVNGYRAGWDGPLEIMVVITPR
jgi:uncharacterized membrane protein